MTLPSFVTSLYNKFESLPQHKIEQYSIRADSAKLNWDCLLQSETVKYKGQGASGTFHIVPSQALFRGKSPTRVKIGVKTGDLGEEELQGLILAGEAGLAPRVLAARMIRSRNGYCQGQIAMEAFEGKRLTDADKIVAGKDTEVTYWKLRAKVHKLGIMHGDMHDENVLIGKSGQGRVIDFGAAQINVWKAFQEAMLGILGGDGACPFPEYNYDNDCQSPLSDVAALILRNAKSILHDFKSDKRWNPSDIQDLNSWSSSVNSSLQRVPEPQVHKLISRLYRGINKF